MNSENIEKGGNQKVLCLKNLLFLRMVVFSFIFFLFIFQAYADGLTYDYPELMVTPRASARLELETNKESTKRWTAHAPIQLSALLTTTAAMIQMSNKNDAKDPNGYASLGGLAVGGTWLVGTLFLSALYTPYSSGLEEIKALPSKTQREQLTQERYAEGAIQKPAFLGKRLKWISFGTNFVINLYMLTKAKGDTLSIPADLIALAGSAIPIVFPYYWERIENEQEEYKKKIYAPIAHVTLFSAQNQTQVTPGLGLTFRF